MRTVQYSFSGGEVSSAMYGRFDDNKYRMGLATCENFICLPQGELRNRPGFEFIRPAKYADKKVRLIPFKYSSDDTAVLEFGDKYMRVHTRGSTVLDASGNPYEIATPYSADDLRGLRFAQSADVMTLVHKSYPVKELRRQGPTNWALVSVSFEPKIAAPSGLTGSYTPGDNKSGYDSEIRYNIKYVVTALLREADGAIYESKQSNVATVSSNLYNDNAVNNLSWSAVSGAYAYRVYKTYSGVYGYIGQTESTGFMDNNVEADQSITPPRYDSVFSATGDYPQAIAYFEQRRFFAGTVNLPLNVWGTKVGTDNDMSYTLPSSDDDRIRFRMVSQQAGGIQHLVPISQFLVLTESGEFRLKAADGAAMSASGVSAAQQSNVGSDDVTPLVVNNVCVYSAKRGGHLRELGYNYNAGGFITQDLAVRASHMFVGNRIVDMTLMQAPEQVLWASTRNGELYGVTYLPEQAINAWHRHITDGFVESVCAVSEDDEDRLYLSVRRVVNGETKRYIERMRAFTYDSNAEAFFVDSGVTYSGTAAVTEISGLSHLEGKTVSVLADGAVQNRKVVTNGKITLDHEAKTVQIGLPFTSRMKTLPMMVQLQDGSYGKGHSVNVNKVWLQVNQSSGVWAGPTFDKLTEYKQRTNEPYGTAPEPVTGEIAVLTTPTWKSQGELCVEQKDPLPLRITGFCAELAQ